MSVSATDHFKTEDAVELYGLDGWGNGYLSIDAQGHLLVSPDRHADVQVDAERKLMNYLTSPEGQRHIGAFNIGGVRLFHPIRGDG